MALRVCETFYSIQGESTFAGLPCFFIRLSGCNLRCTYCDTTYAYDGGQMVERDSLLRAFGQSGAGLVEVTGGEPLLQPETTLLLAGLLDSGSTVLLETNGSCSLRSVPADVVKILDLKCPSSGMTDHMDFDNLQYLAGRDQVKFVIQDRADYEWARDKMLRYYMWTYTQILLSPVSEKTRPRTLAEWMLSDRLPARLQIQLHKHIWPDKERGV